jgi:ribosomal protein L7/L12
MFGIFSTGNQLSPAQAARLARIERKLDLVLEHLGLSYDESMGSDLPEDVRRLADEGRKIEAIKAHREDMGSSLVEAKDAVEAYLRRE